MLPLKHLGSSQIYDRGRDVRDTSSRSSEFDACGLRRSQTKALKTRDVCARTSPTGIRRREDNIRYQFSGKEEKGGRPMACLIEVRYHRNHLVETKTPRGHIIITSSLPVIYENVIFGETYKAPTCPFRVLIWSAHPGQMLSRDGDGNNTRAVFLPPDEAGEGFGSVVMQ